MKVRYLRNYGKGMKQGLPTHGVEWEGYGWWYHREDGPSEIDIWRIAAVFTGEYASQSSVFYKTLYMYLRAKT